MKQDELYQKAVELLDEISEADINDFEWQQVMEDIKEEINERLNAFVQTDVELEEGSENE